jgi:hypothetical protein
MSNGAIAIPAALGWKDQDWAELLACMRLRKVIPVIGEELFQVEIEGETVPLHTWMAKRLASELDVPPASCRRPRRSTTSPCLYLARSDSKRNSIYTRLWIIMDESEGESARSHAAAPTGRDHRFQPFPHARSWKGQLLPKSCILHFTNLVLSDNSGIYHSERG